MSFYALKDGMTEEDWKDFEGVEPPATHMDGPTVKEIAAAHARAEAAKGCGDCPAVIREIMEHVIHARAKHPHWYPSDDYVLSVAEMEWGEFAHALRWESRKRAHEEALDLIAVLVRFLQGDGR